MDSSDWTCCTVTVDSGASETVCNDADFDMINTIPSPGSKRGLKYKVANGEPIPNEGQKQVGFITEEGHERNMLFQVCDVTKPLASVSKICKKGHKVVFEEGCSYIQNLYTGDITWLREENGVFVMDVWLPPLSFQGPGQ